MRLAWHFAFRNYYASDFTAYARLQPMTAFAMPPTGIGPVYENYKFPILPLN